MFQPFSLTIRGKLLNYQRPAVMGIVNLTPDSFFAGSRTSECDDIKRRVEALISAGADMLDVGAYSSRPGAQDVSLDEELRRLAAGMNAVREIAPTIPVSVDTFRAKVAREAVTNLGADIINDITGLDGDSEMAQTVADLKAPYILMHMRGTPATMQSLTDYPDGVVADVLQSFAHKLRDLRLLGVNDVIIDPGFGFAKTVEQNYELLAAVSLMRDMLDAPVLVGISRKSMICRPLEIKPADALNGTTVINTIALLNGASILRVHDPLEAAQAVKLCAYMPESGYKPDDANPNDIS